MDVLKRITDHQGYLVVEYLVSISLMTVVILTLFIMINAVCMAASSDELNSDLHYSARSVMQMIRGDILGATSLQVLNSGHTLRIELGGEVVLYYIESRQLYRAGSAKLPVAENADSICFRSIRPGLVEVIFKAGAADRTYLLQSAFTTRSNH